MICGATRAYPPEAILTDAVALFISPGTSHPQRSLLSHATPQPTTHPRPPLITTACTALPPSCRRWQRPPKAWEDRAYGEAETMIKAAAAKEAVRRRDKEAAGSVDVSLMHTVGRRDLGGGGGGGAMARGPTAGWEAVCSREAWL